MARSKGWTVFCTRSLILQITLVCVNHAHGEGDLRVDNLGWPAAFELERRAQRFVPSDKGADASCSRSVSSAPVSCIVQRMSKVGKPCSIWCNTNMWYWAEDSG